MVCLFIWFVRRIVLFVFVVFIYFFSNKVCWFIYILKRGKIKVVIFGVYNEVLLFNLMFNILFYY